MSATIRTIFADCQTGDGSSLFISTEGQDSSSALAFTIEKPGDEPGEEIQATVYVSAEALVELIGFQNIENARYRAEYVTVDQNEEVPF